MSVKRFDVGSFKKAKKTGQGFLKADAYATRVGIFKYRNGDGKIVREFRSPEEVFKADSLQSLAEVPLTNDHPPEFITAGNSKKYSVGFTSGDVIRNDNFVKVSVTVTDKDAVDIIYDGKTEMSCGYTCDLENIQGEYKGEKYDAVQKNIVYNHLAIVDIGRAGPEVRMRLDSNDAVLVSEENTDSDNVRDEVSEDVKKDKLMAKFKIDSIEFEVEDTGLAQAVTSKIDELDKAKKDSETLKGKFDALEQENKELKDEIKKEKESKLDQSEIMAIAKDRLNLESFAQKVLGDEIKLDSMSDLEIKKEVIAKEKSELDLAEKSDAYIDGCFDMVKESVEASKEKSDSNADKISEKFKNEDQEKNDSLSARDKMMARSRDAWKKPVGRHVVTNTKGE